MQKAQRGKGGGFYSPMPQSKRLDDASAAVGFCGGAPAHLRVSAQKHPWATLPPPA